MGIDINSHTVLYGIIGYPVRHTLSPIIHNECFKRKKINAVYLAFEVTPSDLKRAIDGVRALGVKGLSVTIPHKKACMKYLDEIDKVALGIGAVNTIINIDGKLSGFNTDYLGVMRSFENKKFNVEGKGALVIGSGGASRAVCFALLEMKLNSLYITGIVDKEIKNLVRDIKNNYPHVYVEGFLRDDEKERAICERVDVIVNASPVGMHPDVDKVPINPSFIKDKHTLFDVVYTPQWTSFLKFGKRKGAKVISGVDMFVYQAVEQFKLFTGESVDEKFVRGIIQKKR